jgi:uncharacterized protein YkwD
MSPLCTATASLLFAAAIASWAGCAAAQVSMASDGAPRLPKGGHLAEERPPLSAQALDALRQINAYRAAGAVCGAGGRFEPAAPLNWSHTLERAAELHALDMGQRGNISHQGGDGASLADRVNRQGYGWSRIGENVAAGRATVPATLAQWMDSPGHCANIMNKTFSEVALASRREPGKTYEWFWAMVLGAPR